MARRRYYTIVVPLYVLLAFQLLWGFGGVAACAYDGYAPSMELPGFRPPPASIADYDHHWTIRFQYRIPYISHAGLLTLAGCALPAWQLRRLPRLSRWTLVRATAVGFCSVLLIPAASDLACVAGIWCRQTWFAAGLPLFLEVLLPLAVLTGLVVFAAPPPKAYEPFTPPMSIR